MRSSGLPELVELANEAAVVYSSVHLGCVSRVM